MQIGKKRQAPMRRWRPSAQETLVEFASAQLGLLLGWPINFNFIDSVSHHLQQLLILQGLGRASSPLRGRKLPSSHCKLSQSGRSIWRHWTEIGTRPSPFPAPDRTVSPTSADAALPRQQRDPNRGAHS